MTYPATNSTEATKLIIDGGNQLHEIINEDALTTITTESGEIPSVRKAITDTFLFQDPIAWNQGSDETAFNQLRTFNSETYWAPTATLSTPVPMGVTPVGDSNWKIAPVGSNNSVIQGWDNQAQEELINGKIYPEIGTLSNGDTVPLGTTHLRVLVGGESTIVAMSPIASGVVSLLTNSSVTIGATPVKFTTSNVINIHDVSDMINRTGLFEGAVVRTRKYNTEIVQDWLITSTNATSDYYVLLSNGLYAKEISNVKYLESFGAYADGVTLDDDAFLFAQSYPDKVEGKGDYLISNSYNLTNGTKWKGNWSKISAQGSNQLFLFTDCEFGDFELDGLSGAHTAYPTQIASPSENVKLGDLIYRNFAGVIANFQTYPLNIPMYGAKNFSVGNVIFYDITQEDDGSVTGPGFVGGIYLVGLDSEVANGQSYGKVGDVYGFTVKSVDAGSGVVQDSDLIRTFAETPDTRDFDITFGNIHGRNVYKRIVKAASCGGLTFGNVQSFNPDDGVESYTLHSAVEVLSTGFNMRFGNVTVEGDSARAVWFKGKGNTAETVFDGAGCQAVIFGSTGDPCFSSQVGNVIGRGLNNASQQGTAVTFFNADQCQSGGITGLFAVALNTESENAGCNTVGDITCPARVNAIYGTTIIGAIEADIQGTVVAGSHYSLGQEARIKSAQIITDGRVTMSVSGTGVDVDLGRTRIVRASANNGVETSHSVFTTVSALNGILRGSLEIEVNASVAGTPSGASGKTLAYFTGLNVDDFDLSMNVTASTRGATGFNYWFNNVNGQANRVAVKSAMSLVGSQINGLIGISKLEYLVTGGSTVTCTGEVNIGFTEKDAAAVISGANFNPNVVNSTR